MAAPGEQPPTDTDRIIAAQRDEARKTRALLVWIFVVIPLVGSLIWLVAYYGTRATPPARNTPTIDPTTEVCAQIGDAAAYDVYCSDVPTPR